MRMAQDHHYTLLELRVRNWTGAAAVDSGDVETSWHTYLGTVRKFYEGDYPAARLYSTLSGLEEIEESTPRVQHALLLQREALGVLELSENRGLIPPERLHLAAVAIRAGADAEAREQMRLAQEGLAGKSGDSIRGFLVENQEAMASLYLDHGDLTGAAKMLDAAYDHLKDEKNTFHSRDYALGRGRLELALGHPGNAESPAEPGPPRRRTSHHWRRSQKHILAQQDRDLYAVLAGVWLARAAPAKMPWLFGRDTGSEFSAFPSVPVPAKRSPASSRSSPGPCRGWDRTAFSARSFSSTACCFTRSHRKG